jgi:hypothetical protein
MSPSYVAIFATDAYTSPGFITAISLDMTGDPCGTLSILEHLENDCLLGAFFTFLQKIC